MRFFPGPGSRLPKHDPADDRSDHHHREPPPEQLIEQLLRVALVRQRRDAERADRRQRRQIDQVTAEALRPRIQSIVDELLAAVPAGDFDAMRDLALPLPYFVIADMIGLPRADRPQIKAWSTDFAVAIGGAFSADVALRANDSLRAFGDYLRPIVARLRAARVI